MLLPIPDVLKPEQVTEARRILESAEWIDGRVTAGHQSSRTKDNLQLPENSPAARQVTGTPHRIRTDLSATLFFTAPDEYDGGELVVEDVYGTHNVKLPPGHMILYPASSLHHVRPVTRGARIASFFWIQSMVRDGGERSLLFDLDMAIQRSNRDMPDAVSAVQLTGVYHNLLRRWADA